MDEQQASGLTIVGGRPSDGGEARVGASPGLEALLRRLAEDPRLAHDLVGDPEGTVSAEGLTLTDTEMAMLHHLDAEDLAQTRSAPRGVEPKRGMPATGTPVDDEEARRRAVQLELVAPFASDPDFYLYDGTRGIRPQSIYPSPFAVAEALIRTSQEFREAFLQDWRQAVLTWPDLPLDEQEREALLWEPICKRLEWVARNV